MSRSKILPSAMAERADKAKERVKASDYLDAIEIYHAKGYTAGMMVFEFHKAGIDLNRRAIQHQIAKLQTVS